MQQQQYDLLDPGRARLGIGRDGDVRGSESHRRVQSLVLRRVAAVGPGPALDHAEGHGERFRTVGRAELVGAEGSVLSCGVYRRIGVHAPARHV